MTRLKDVPQDAQKAFEGWAIANTTAVQEWLSPGHPDYKSLRMTMLSGIALADPEMAFGLICRIPARLWSRGGSFITVFWDPGRTE